MKRVWCLWIMGMVCLANLAWAQNRVSLNGSVLDGASGETLIGAAVSAPALGIGAYTNEYGFFSLSVPAEDSVTIRVSFLGYETQELRLLPSTEKIQVSLEPVDREVEGLVIEATGLDEKLNSSQMSMDQLSMVEAKKLPALFGEVDIIKTLQLKPGVQSGGEGTSGIYVRGGGPDQNLILLDEAQVYNATHLFGFFSTFNSDAVKDVKLYKGGFPAEYGGRLSSVIDVRLNEGNKKRFSGSGGLGLISSRLTLEGPIVKDKASYMIAGRRTYFDVFTRMINDINEGKEGFNPIPDYYFYDLNAKVNVNLSDKDQLFVSGYLGRDVFGFASGDFAVDFDWGNTTGALRWTHIFGPKTFMKTIATYSDYNYKISNQFSQFSFELGSGVTDITGQTELVYLPNAKHEIKAGVQYTNHQFEIGRLNASSEDGTVDFQSGNNYSGHEMGAYVNENWKVNPRLELNAGLRLSAFENDGAFFYGLEPRASGKFSINEKLSWKASYTRMFQYVHMVSNSGASLPTDIWYPSNAIVNPQRADQVATGMSLKLGRDWLVTDEVYYKWLKNQVDFRDGAQIFVNPNLDDEFVFGKGWGYGNEIYFEKQRGPGNTWKDRTSGWIGYTLSWSWREFADINRGTPFHPRYDRRHDISVVLMHDLGKRWTLTAAWVYGTGQAVSLPVGRYIAQGPTPGGDISFVPVYLDRNSFRMPAYHRMDLGVVMKMFPKWGESDLTFSAYNAYNRRNPYFIYYDTENDENGNPVRFVPKQVSLFPIIPSVAWNFKF